MSQDITVTVRSSYILAASGPTPNKNGRTNNWLALALMAVLAGSLSGCASYVGVDSGYSDTPVYYDGWYPDADIDLFGGGYYDGGDVYGYSRRGHMSRGGGGWGHGGWGHGGGGHFGGGGHGGGGHGGGHG